MPPPPPPPLMGSRLGAPLPPPPPPPPLPRMNSAQLPLCLSFCEHQLTEYKFELPVLLW